MNYKIKQNKYGETKTSVTSLFRKTKDFTVKLGVHHGSALRSNKRGYDAPRCIMFAINAVIIDKNTDMLEGVFECLREVLKKN